MSRYPATALLALVLGATGSFASGESPGAAAAAFYRVYATFHPSDGIPDAKARSLYDPVVSPALDKLLADADAAANHFGGAHKDSPPVMEGDLFTSNFEGATSFRVGACETRGQTARCKIDLAYDGGPKPIAWTDTVLLVASEGGWRVDDIAYGAPFATGNKGRLTDTLKRAISDSGA